MNIIKNRQVRMLHLNSFNEDVSVNFQLNFSPTAFRIVNAMYTDPDPIDPTDGFIGLTNHDVNGRLFIIPNTQGFYNIDIVYNITRPFQGNTVFKAYTSVVSNGQLDVTIEFLEYEQPSSNSNHNKSEMINLLQDIRDLLKPNRLKEPKPVAEPVIEVSPSIANDIITDPNA